MTGLWRRFVNLLVAMILAVSAVAMLPGCEKKGPLEEAGEEMDEAIEETGEAIEEATER